MYRRIAWSALIVVSVAQLILIGLGLFCLIQY